MTTKPLDLAQFEGHTPGPWGAPGTNVYAQQGRIVATAEAATYPLRVANARLIAAAPALLALAKQQQEQIAERDARIAKLREALTLAVHQHENLVGAARAAASDKLYGPNGLAHAALADTETK